MRESGTDDSREEEGRDGEGGKGRGRLVGNADLDYLSPELERGVSVNQSRHYHREPEEGEDVLRASRATDDERDAGTEQHRDVKTLREESKAEAKG
jgi:hypothetical protein